MKDTLSVIKKRNVKNADIILEKGILMYLDEEMDESKPLADVFAPFIGDTCTITIVNKEESDDITTEAEDEE